MAALFFRIVGIAESILKVHQLFECINALQVRLMPEWVESFAGSKMDTGNNEMKLHPSLVFVLHPEDITVTVRDSTENSFFKPVHDRFRDIGIDFRFFK